MSARNIEEDAPASGTKVHIEAEMFDGKKMSRLHIKCARTENQLHSGCYDEAHDKIVLKDGFRGRFVRGTSKDQLVFWREHEDDKDESMTFERAITDAESSNSVGIDAENSKLPSLEEENVPPRSNPISCDRAPGTLPFKTLIQPPLRPLQEKLPNLQPKLMNDSDVTDDEVLAGLSGGAAMEDDVTAEAAVSEKVVTNDAPGASNSESTSPILMDHQSLQKDDEPSTLALSPSAVEGNGPEASNADDSEMPEESEATDEDEDDSEVFAEYMPAFAPAAFSKSSPKVHPSLLVETASLTAVRTKPPSFPLEDSLGPVASAGLLSAAQLESVLCACEAHSWHIRAADQFSLPAKVDACMRAGFSLGDGAGD